MNLKLIVLFGMVHCISSCSDYLKYYRDYDGTSYGLLTIRPGPVQQINLEVWLSVPGISDGTADNMFLINTDLYNDLINYRDVQYRVYPSIMNPLPTPISIKLNGRQLCTGVPATARAVLTSKLHHVISISVANIPQNFYQPGMYAQPQFNGKTMFPQIAIATPRNDKDFYTPESNQNFEIKNNFITQPPQKNYQCGVRNEDRRRNVNSQRFSSLNIDSQRFTSLIIGGQNANPNEFPWLAAFFYKNEFQCSGSLVSKNIVVFAAHCVEDKGETTQKKPYDSRFELGKHDIENSNEVNSVSSGVENFILHPSWKPFEQRYNGDIAVAILNTEIKFTAYISPICLWQQTNNHDDLINKKGVIAGWGVTEDGYISRTPRHVSLPAVSDAVCLRSNSGFSAITSHSTFCVGDKKGSVPCKGDSGAGFAIKSGNSYYLRGLVSVALIDEFKRCNRYEYVVFTDTAQYTNWIERFIQVYA